MPMVKLKKNVAEYVVQNCPGRTDRVLMDHFGISYNTFRKIEAGERIRGSVAFRLENRLMAGCNS